MTTKGGYAAAMPRQAGGDRLYKPPPRRYQQEILEKQQRMQKQQQSWRKEAVQQEFLLAESVSGGDFSSKTTALPLSRSLGHVSPVIVTNLDRLMEAVTPFVKARLSSDSEVRTRRQRSRDLNSVPFYYMEDLWESYSEWSVYGAGVSLMFNGSEPIEQFYVPSLSGIQLYMGKSCSTSRTRGPKEDIVESNWVTTIVGCSDSEGDTRGKSAVNTTTQRVDRLSLQDNSVVSSSSSSDADESPRVPLFQYLEHEQPYNRRPFSEKISLLASQSPELSKFKSSDLHSSSWMCVAWYPIYRIPIGSTLQDLDSSFLTFHLLSTQPRTNKPALFHGPNSRKGIEDPIPRISLPVFALASYKMKGSIVSPSRPNECEQEESLLQAADKWLADIQVKLPDYQFFRGHYSPRR